MKENTKRFFSRVGAGLMLGLSLVNLGVIWSRQKGTELPKRAKQIRRREQEEIKPVAQQIANVAQEEAQTAVLEQQQEFQETQVVESKKSEISQTVRYSAIAIWAVLLVVFFTSMIFNAPLRLGQGALSLLPGVPHLAKLSLVPVKEYFKENEEIPVEIRIDTQGEAVQQLKAFVSFDPQELSFIAYRLDESGFENLQRAKIDEQTGTIELILENKNPQALKSYKNKNVAVLYFRALANKNIQGVNLEKTNSLVLRAKDGANILGATTAKAIKIIPLIEQERSQPNYRVRE